MASQLTAGKEVLSYCTKCKLALNHVIVAMKDEKTIHKVKCKTCSSTHAYKDPSLATTKKKRTTTAGRKKKTQTVAVSIADLWMKKMAETSQKSQPYKISGKFEVGDVLDHVKFGPGIVESIVDNDKIEVMFRHEIKTLIHNKA